MKFVTATLLTMGLCTLIFVSCRKEGKESARLQTDNISQEVKNKILALGFSPTGVQRIEEGYLVEGDIILTEQDLNSVPEKQFLIVGNEEQYRTYNLVTGLPRNITISVNSNLPSRYVTLTDD